LGDLEEELKSLPAFDVDLLTPGDLPPEFRAKVLAERNRYERNLPDYLPHSAGSNRCAQLRGRDGQHTSDHDSHVTFSLIAIGEAAQR
jgi:hypothetical protein